MPRRSEYGSEATALHYQVFAFGSDEELIAVFGSLDAAAAAWHRIQDRFLERWNLWGMPQAWWRFESSVPEELRLGPALVLDEADAEAWRTLDLARRRFLAARGVDPTPPIGRPFGEPVVGRAGDPAPARSRWRYRRRHRNAR